MNWTLLLPLEPLRDAGFVEFAQALQPGQCDANLVLLHADGAFLRTAVLIHAIFLCGDEGQHAHQGRGLRLGT